MKKRPKEHGAADAVLIKKKKETATTSTNAAVARAGTAPRGNKLANVQPGKAKQESANFTVTGKFREVGQAGASPQGKRFRVTLLQEGLGNLKDCYFYTKDAIQSGPKVFEGRHFFINHPGAAEETDRPERDINDLSGYFENCAAEPGDDGRLDLNGDLVLITGAPQYDQYRALILESLAYVTRHPDQDLIGLSINANGDSAEMPLDLFMQEYQVPASCMDKLQEALDQGVATIKPVTVIKSAVSCDMVTAAGAGGRINTLLEGSKGKMAKQEGKQEGKQEEESGAADAGGADGSADAMGGHPDEQQDVELIKKMLNKYLGDGFTDEDHKMAAEALKHAGEMGMEGEEAMKCAGYHMKMAKHMQAKQEAEECGKQEEGGAGPGDQDGLDAHSPNPVAGATPPAKSQKFNQARQESAAGSRGGNDMVKMAAEVARLSRELDNMKLKEHADKSLRESKLPMAATKKFRESIQGVRSAKEFDEKLKLFKEAYSLGGEAEDSGFVYGAEKTDAGTQGGLAFGDCVE
jgi:hypothetical protein